MAETFAPGASLSLVARRCGLNANMLFTWRRPAAIAASSGAAGAVTFVPLTIIAEPGPMMLPAVPAPTVAWRSRSPVASG